MFAHGLPQGDGSRPGGMDPVAGDARIRAGRPLEHGGLRRLEASFLHPAPEGDVILGGQVFFHAELTRVLALCEGRGKQEEQDSYESEKSFHGL